jgi:glucose/mannose-6-phosphate isomerase
MMRDAILSINEQLAYAPVVSDPEKLKSMGQVVLVGMGGSNLAGDILRRALPTAKILPHRNYGLPVLGEADLRYSLIIANSYSGNTEETISAYEEAKRRKCLTAVVASGGELLERAKESAIPHVKLPATGTQPRSAVGYSLKATMKLMGLEEELNKVTALSKTLRPEKYEERGEKVAAAVRDHVPIIYASAKNIAIAYNWKIKFNETGKIPAFYNVFPELNHNEIEGFDAKSTTQRLSERMSFIFIFDEEDHPRVIRRMEVLALQLRDKRFTVIEVNLEGESIYEKMFNSLTLASFTALYTAEAYGLDPEDVPMIEDFKRRIAD